jgi:predicted nucleic acid-binding Zn ribbon protein
MAVVQSAGDEIVKVERKRRREETLFFFERLHFSLIRNFIMERSG